MTTRSKIVVSLLVLTVGLLIYYFKYLPQSSNLDQGLASGNGRIETTQVDITSKLSGRLINVKVEEGDIVQKGELLAKLDTKELDAKLHEANANLEQAKQNKKYALAIVNQRESELDLANKNYERSSILFKKKSIPLVELQKDETILNTAKAALTAAKSQVVSAGATIKAAQARIETIKVNIEESNLYSPVKGRVLYKLVQNGEMVTTGSKVLVVLDLMNTYMSIFLPTSQAGKVSIGSDARIVLDAVPNAAIPAKVTFVSPLAQFTPKEIETKTEREKLMFRVKVKIDPRLLEKYFERIKTGLPGVAYVKLDKDAKWPVNLKTIPIETGK